MKYFHARKNCFIRAIQCFMLRTSLRKDIKLYKFCHGRRNNFMVKKIKYCSIIVRWF